MDRAQKQAYLEGQVQRCDQLNEMLDKKFYAIENILLHHIEKCSRSDRKIFAKKEIDYADINRKMEAVIPSPNKPHLQKPLKFRIFNLTLGGEQRYQRAVNRAHDKYRKKLRSYENSLERRESLRHREIDSINEYNFRIRQKYNSYKNVNREGIEFYVENVCGIFCIEDHLDLGDTSFCKTFQLDDNPRDITINLWIPPADEIIGDVKRFRYIKTQDEFRTTKIVKKEKKRIYDLFICQVTLCITHDIFEYDCDNIIENLCINIIRKDIHPADGHLYNEVLLSLYVRRADYLKINIRNIDPIECVKMFGARISRNSIENKGVDPYKSIHSKSVETK